MPLKAGRNLWVTVASMIFFFTEEGKDNKF